MKILRIPALLLVLGGFIFLSRQPPPKHYLSVGAIFRNEERFLKEWIEYHHMLGVDHFYLLNHFSDDNYKQVLAPYIESGLVELSDWTEETSDQKAFKNMQCRAYGDLIEKTKKETAWLAIIDIDEFIALKHGNSIPKFLKEYEQYGGIGINWQLFGTAGVQRISESETLIGSLIKRAPKDFDANRFVKTICRPKRVRKMAQPHFCKYKFPFGHVTEQKTPFPYESLTPEVSVERISLNHYTHRDEDFFYTEKKRRILEWFPEAKVEMDPVLNEVEDLSMLRLVPELQTRLSDPCTGTSAE